MNVFLELKKLDAFKSLSEVALVFLTEHIKVKSFKPDEIILNEGEKVGYFYIIAKGSCSVIKTDHATGIQHLITSLTQGDTIGEMSLFDPQPASTIIRGKKSGKLYAISMKDMEAFSKLFPADYFSFTKILSKALTKRIRHIDNIATYSLTEKLENAKLRIKMGNFIVLTIGLLCLYSFLLSITTKLIVAYNSDLIASSLVLSLVLVGTLIFLSYEKKPLVEYGFKMHHWKKNIIEAFMLTLPVLLLMLIIKFILIHIIPVLNDTLFNGVIIAKRENAYLLLIIYILSCPIQELIARGILQTSLRKFLTNASDSFVILFSNLIYSTFHLYLSFFYAIATFLPGLFFGWLYARQKSLLGPIISHIMVGVWGIYILGVHDLILK